MSLKLAWLATPLLLACVHLAEAQQPKNFHRLGYLSEVDPARESARSGTIMLGLRRLGYIEGQNIAIEYRYAADKRDRFPKLAAELAGLKLDIIVAAGGFGLIAAAKNATHTTPIVMLGFGSDPVGAGLVDSLARPGGNVTGLTNLTGELGGKRLELLKEAVRRVSNIAVLYDPATRSNVIELKEVLPVAARALELTVQPWEVRDANSFERTFATMSKQGPQGALCASRPANEC